MSVLNVEKRDRKKVGDTRQFLRRIFGPKVNNFTQKYEIISNEEIYNAFGESNIIGVIRTKY